MYTIIIFTFIFFIVSFVINIRQEYDTIDNLIKSMITMIPGLLLGLMVAIILPAKTEIRSDRIQLVNLNDGQNIEGRFFLGSGQIEGVMKYTYYYKIEDYYKLGTIDADRVLIKYTDGPAYMEIREKIFSDGYLINKFSFFTRDSQTIMHIPEGSIKIYYHLDAQ